MKILQVIPMFDFGGAEIMCENLIYALLNCGHRVIVISLYTFESPITERMKKRGIDIRFLDKKPGIDLSVVRKLRRIIKQEKPDALHTHLYVTRYTVPASLGLGIKQVHTFHSIASKENTRLGIALNQLFFRFNKVVPVALSKQVKDTIIEQYHLPPANVPVVFNGINLSSCIHKQNSELHCPTRLIHIGRFVDVKNHITMLKAIKQLHETHQIELKLVGDGELAGDIRQYISDNNMGEYVNMVGKLDSVYDLLSNSDIFILPSKYEGIPMTLIEAMGTGLPIIASDVGGIPDMITNGKEGILIRPEANELAEAAKALITNNDMREQLGKNALERSREFSAANMAASYSDIYSDR